MHNILVSVIACTYNRPQLLKSTLESLIKLDFNPEQFEIIVVDNGNNNQSLEVYKEINQNGRCRITYIPEETQGLSYARNKGITCAQGKTVAFLDDDEIVPANWLTELIKPYTDDDLIACVGGKIIPVFPDDQPPSWYSAEIAGFFGGVDHGGNIHDVDFSEEYIGGGNMSFKRQVLVDSGMFNVRLGIIGTSSYSGEENELAQRIQNKGFRVLYNPFAITYHRIETERISKQFFRKRCFQSGKAEMMYNPLNHGSPFFLFLKNTFILCQSLASYLISIVRSEAVMMRASLAVSRSLGNMAGCIKLMTHSDAQKK